MFAQRPVSLQWLNWGGLPATSGPRQRITSVAVSAKDGHLMNAVRQDRQLPVRVGGIAGSVSRRPLMRRRQP